MQQDLSKLFLNIMIAENKTVKENKIAEKQYSEFISGKQHRPKVVYRGRKLSALRSMNERTKCRYPTYLEFV